MAEGWSRAWITGAGSGLGYCLAHRLAGRGVKLMLLDRHFSDEARAALEEAAPGGLLLTADITDRPSLERAAANGLATLGPPDLVIHCAGVQRARAFADLSADEFEQVIAVNLIGSRNLAAVVLPHMRPGSRLVLVASLAGLTPVYGYAAYNASKYGVIGLAGALRLEYKLKGIGVSVACPPEFDSPMVVEEHKTAPDPTFKMKEFTNGLTVDRVADTILDRARAGQWMIIPGGRARLTAVLARYFPGLINRIGDRMVKKALK